MKYDKDFEKWFYSNNDCWFSYKSELYVAWKAAKKECNKKIKELQKNINLKEK